MIQNLQLWKTMNQALDRLARVIGGGEYEWPKAQLRIISRLNQVIEDDFKPSPHPK